ncbi:Fatty acid desaturase [Actinomadura rubteroloni]|uniref:Fatty acid desaturase n=1 Tax=Actinomadura rubteroloni TaxID=1926885 RepID=A0A2P4UN50_9ACTN|nr:fatty acid desaturase family protein [Actinomadura rubteroloni]POM26471.1 Fatty acid desaturase [Actinomadura rubteroloni]
MPSPLHEAGRPGASDRTTPGSPFPRGYQPPSHLRPVVKAAHRTLLVRPIADALLDHVFAVALALGGALALLHLPLTIGVPSALVALVAIGRQLRALECLTHEASHYSFSRRQRLNDLLGQVLAGLPTGASLGDYRRSHRIHHTAFGTEADPDLARYRELGIERLRRHSRVLFALDVLRRLPRYQRGWLATVRSQPMVFAAPFGWAGLAVALPVAAFDGFRAGLLTACLWLLAQFTSLPVIRFLGESEEHIYAGRYTVFDTTISNIGLRNLLLKHPHNDGYHTVHHMWPAIPYYRTRRLHELLMKQDPEYAGRVVLGPPKTSSPDLPESE